MFNEPFDSESLDIKMFNRKLRNHKGGKFNVPNRDAEYFGPDIKVKQMDYVPSVSEVFLAGAFITAFILLVRWIVLSWK